jgi:hypothetical protein
MDLPRKSAEVTRTRLGSEDLDNDMARPSEVGEFILMAVGCAEK